jgi:hypothetical protein
MSDLRRRRVGACAAVESGLMNQPVHERKVSVVVRNMREAEANAYVVPGSPAERIAMVWPLTAEVCSLAGGFDAESRLPRSVVRILPPRR